MAQAGTLGSRQLVGWCAVLGASITLASLVNAGLTGGGALASPTTVAISPATAALADGDDIRARHLATADGELQLTGASESEEAPHACSSHSTYFGSLGWLIYNTAQGSTCAYVIAEH